MAQDMREWIARTHARVLKQNSSAAPGAEPSGGQHVAAISNGVGSAPAAASLHQPHQHPRPVENAARRHEENPAAHELPIGQNIPSVNRLRELYMSGVSLAPAWMQQLRAAGPLPPKLALAARPAGAESVAPKPSGFKRFAEWAPERGDAAQRARAAASSDAHSGSSASRFSTALAAIEQQEQVPEGADGPPGSAEGSALVSLKGLVSVDMPKRSHDYPTRSHIAKLSRMPILY